jgi:hypothetical protein
VSGASRGWRAGSEGACWGIEVVGCCGAVVWWVGAWVVVGKGWCSSSSSSA